MFLEEFWQKSGECVKKLFFFPVPEEKIAFSIECVRGCRRSRKKKNENQTKNEKKKQVKHDFLLKKNKGTQNLLSEWLMNFFSEKIKNTFFFLQFFGKNKIHDFE